jgi:hypothetical protein
MFQLREAPSGLPRVGELPVEINLTAGFPIYVKGSRSPCSEDTLTQITSEPHKLKQGILESVPACPSGQFIKLRAV